MRRIGKHVQSDNMMVGASSLSVLNFKSISFAADH